MIFPINLRHFCIENNSSLQKMSITGWPFSFFSNEGLGRALSQTLSASGFNGLPHRFSWITPDGTLAFRLTWINVWNVCTVAQYRGMSGYSATAVSSPLTRREVVVPHPGHSFQSPRVGPKRRNAMARWPAEPTRDPINGDLILPYQL